MNPRSGVISVVLVILMMLGTFLWVLPVKAALPDLIKQRDEVVAQSDTLQSQLAEIQSLSDSTTESESARDHLLQAVPLGFAQDTLIEELFKLAADMTFDLSSVSFSPGGEASIGALTISANLEGSFKDLQTFVKRLDSASRLLKLKSFSLQRLESDKILFTLSLEAYYQ